MKTALPKPTSRLTSMVVKAALGPAGFVAAGAGTDQAVAAGFVAAGAGAETVAAGALVVFVVTVAFSFGFRAALAALLFIFIFSIFSFSRRRTWRPPGFPASRLRSMLTAAGRWPGLR
jgi:hypothetical protein